jgi:hypothetical protein
MPRNAQGQYFLPDGNPVTPGELIKSEWANSTMDDIAVALTQSLDRAGAGGMTGQLKAATGTTARPGISFVEDVESGINKKSPGVVAAIASGVEQAYWTRNGFFVVTAPADAMEVANKAYVDALASQATKIIGEFGQSKTPAQLPPNGYIPVNWDATGVPAYGIQMQNGQSLAYRPNNTADPLYDHIFVYVGTNFVSTGWIDIGAVEGPPGPQGETGAVGPVGPEGPTGPQGPSGATGPIGPAGPQGIQGPVGPQGIQGSPGASSVIVGSFGVSKTPANLPENGLIPANWDAPGSPPADYQMKPGEALVYTDCPVGTPNYGHVYEYVPDSISMYDLNNWVDLGDIVGPQGPVGAQGPQGNPGPQGPAGTNGSDGAEGPQGPAGPQGNPGPQGPKGDTGAQGIPGPAYIGQINMFAGAQYIPSGWHICDGQNGTVDLRDKFIVASGGKFAAGTAGGGFTITEAMLAAHTHSIDATTGSGGVDHVHGLGSGAVTVSGNTGGMSANASHAHGVSDPGHTHTPQVGNGGKGAGWLSTTGGSGGLGWGSGAGAETSRTINGSGTGIGIQQTNTDHVHGFSATANLSGNSGGASAFAHTHTLSGTSGATGGGQEFIPSYFALVFAQYTGA